MSTSSITGSHGSWMINDLGRVGRGLYRLRKIHSGWFWEGHDFSRADKFLPFDTPSMLQHARNRLSRVFPQLALAVPFQSAKSIGLLPRAR